MRKLLVMGMLLCGAGAFAQSQYLQFYYNGGVDSYNIADDDSIYFDATHTNLYFSNNGTVHTFAVADIDSITFLNDVSKNVYITYNGTSATVVNPMAASGVTIAVTNAGVTVTSTSAEKNINYILTGVSSNGYFKVYSNEKYNILLDNLTLTNTTGPAVNLQSGKNATIHLVSGTISVLSDGGTYAAAPVVSGVTEDQKAALFCEGTIEMVGAGTLTVNGSGSQQHAIASDDEIKQYEGTLIVASAVVDGIHSDGYYMNGGSTSVAATGDGIDAGTGVFEMNCGVITVNSTSARYESNCYR